ncbi:MAG TPA: SGNH/GDSL hydrolase family protein [Candidatus Nitrosotenuis sp.]|nr:SGNH/GDSL hydrolase family protein [Candidatus Nitrosotenuis sp.]
MKKLSPALVVPLLLGMVSFSYAEEILPKGKLQDLSLRLLRHVQVRNRIQMEGDRQRENYYEELVDEGSQAVPLMRMLGGLTVEGRGWLRFDRMMMVKDHEFLGERYRPNARVNSPIGPITTNSFRMVDKEYSLEKPAGTRRIVLLGDSITRGLGVPQELRCESLLEDWLNELSAQHGGGKVEILNQSVIAYRLSKFLYLAQEAAPAFSPDVYIVALTPLQHGLRWSDDIGNLVRNRKHPRYPFIEDLIRRAELKPEESRDVHLKKLEPFHRETMRWFLAEMKATAERQRVSLLVLLLPSVMPLAEMQQQFRGTIELLNELAVPYLNVLDVFRDHEHRLSSLAIGGDDEHPTVEANGMIFHALQKQLRERPELQSLLLDSSAALPAAARQGKPASSGSSRSGN